jgi:2-polyprenyl-3-methyl-5-hydroxy-6-metoxy-1,4-benzoquinol methylase
MLKEISQTTTAELHSKEIADGERFGFGENWSNFLNLLNEERILRAEESLKTMLEVENLRDKTFLDIGSGSGLFSLAAYRLGAKVQSFDFDTDSFNCTSELKRRYCKNDEDWQVAQSSVLDKEYVSSLGKFDVVYSWGVLHHTGEMWKAIEHATIPCKIGGKTFIAIYNDTGNQVERWKFIKHTYNQLPRLLQKPFAAVVILPEELKHFLSELLLLRPQKYIKTWTNYTGNRGMNRWYDIVDWVGGYPYEVASPEEIFEFYKVRGFRLTKMKCRSVGLGCNEFVFEKEN